MEERFQRGLWKALNTPPKHRSPAKRKSSELDPGSNSRQVSKKVMPPQFSIAPFEPPGRAIRSQRDQAHAAEHLPAHS
jgi:hypothetical protein